MDIRKLAAAFGLAAFAAMLGVASFSQFGMAPQSQASAHRPGQTTYIPPTVPAMHLGMTKGEETTSTTAAHLNR